MSCIVLSYDKSTVECTGGYLVSHNLEEKTRAKGYCMTISPTTICLDYGLECRVRSFSGDSDLKFVASHLSSTCFLARVSNNHTLPPGLRNNYYYYNPNPRCSAIGYLDPRRGVVRILDKYSTLWYIVIY